MKKNGFAVAASLFLIVTLALMGSALWRMVASSAEQSAQSSMGIKAYQAAKAGLELGLYSSARSGSCVASQTLNFPNLTEFTVALTCSRVSVNEAGTAMNVDTWVSTACNRTLCPTSSGLTGGYVERQLSAQVIN